MPRIWFLVVGILSVTTAAAAQSPALREADAHFQAKRWRAAEQAYQSILQSDSTVALAWYRLGRVALEASGDALRAAHNFESSLRHGFTPAYFAHFGIARAYTKLGRLDAALAQLERAVGTGFSQSEAITGDSILRRLSSHPRYPALLAQVRRNVEPCEHTPEARQLDFWIGTWDVFAPNGQPQGTNRIEKMLRGCALLENWTSGGGRDGKSLNFFDPQRKTWRQVWVSDGGSVLDYRAGEYHDGAMRFSGVTLSPQGDTVLQKLTFYNVSPDTVRQVFEQATSRGGNWTVTWTGIYVRRKQN